MTHSNALGLKISAISAALVVLTLVMLIFLSSALPYNQSAVTSGAETLPLADQPEMIRRLGELYTVDLVLIVAWILAWTGLGVLLVRTDRLIAVTSTILGILGACLDFLENEISWALFMAALDGDIYEAGIIIHTVVRQMSYLLPYAGAAVAAIGLASLKSLSNHIAALVGSIGVIIAIVGNYVDALALLPTLWFGAWFASLSCVLWIESSRKKLSHSPI